MSELYIMYLFADPHLYLSLALPKRSVKQTLVKLGTLDRLWWKTGDAESKVY